MLSGGGGLCLKNERYDPAHLLRPSGKPPPSYAQANLPCNPPPPCRGFGHKFPTGGGIAKQFCPQTLGPSPPPVSPRSSAGLVTPQLKLLLCILSFRGTASQRKHGARLNSASAVSQEGLCTSAWPGEGDPPRDALEGGEVPPPPSSRAPSLCPATVPLTPSASLNGICNRQ